MSIEAHDPVGTVALFKRIANSTSTIDIYVRMDGQNYLFEGDWLKSVMPHVESIHKERDAELSEVRISNDQG